MQHIALFGTSADPPTEGHRAILVWLAQRFDYVAVWAADNPFKAHQTPLNHRSTMLRLLISDIQGDPASTSDLAPVAVHTELSHPRTIMTVQRAKQQWPQALLTLVIGADLVCQLPQWYKIENLLRLVNFLVIPRSGHVLQGDDLDRLRVQGATIEVADLSTPASSSTAYRERRDPKVITRPVAAYIHQEHLYEWQNVAPEKVEAR